MNGTKLRDAIISGANHISNNKTKIDQLNVFPVPDGDTGTNMSMTSQAAAKALSSLSSPSAGEAMQTAASAMLRGARGNSGVILSLLFRGMAKALQNKKELTPDLLAKALESGVKEAYHAVMKPTEGTVLTVARLSAEAAQKLTSQELPEMFSQIVERAKQALEQTPEILPVLKRAGVVDAGGMGYVTMLEGMEKVIAGGEPIALASSDSPKKLSNPAAEFNCDISFDYCTEYIVNRVPGKDPLALRAYLESIGDCVVVVADEDIIKVHVHTNHPGSAIEEGLKFGWLTNLKIDNMRVQHETKSHAAAQSKQQPDYAAVDPAVEVGFVAVAAGNGVRNLFSELGANAVVSGGQTMNPSTEDLLAAIQSVGAKTVFVLPNNKNIIMSSEQAAELADRNVIVMQTRTIPEGMAALLAYDSGESLSSNKAIMAQAAEHVKTGMITFAARDSFFNGRQIGKNEILALEKGKISFTDKDATKAAYRLLKRMIDNSNQFVTIFHGADISSEQAETLYDSLKDKFGSQLEINLIDGGQPVYYYILSVE